MSQKRSSSSPLGLAYIREPLAHRMLIFQEAAGISESVAYFLRTLQSEGEFRHQLVRNCVPIEIVQTGPCGLIVTTTANSLHPENETRQFSITIDEGPDHTKAIMAAHARRYGAPEQRPVQAVPEEWLDFQRWLALQPAKVFIPYAEVLSGMIDPTATRLTRDFPGVLSLIEACALLHQASRRRNEGGWIQASVEDYRQVRMLVSQIVAEAVEASVPPTVRQTVDAVETLEHLNLWEGVSVTQIASQLRLNKATASRRVDKAIALGYLRNTERRLGVPARIRLADPMPKKDVPVLPETKALKEAIAKQLHAARKCELR